MSKREFACVFGLPLVGVVAWCIMLGTSMRPAAADGPKVDVGWEVVSGPNQRATWRSRTPGGWLVVVAPGSGDSTAAFVPDPDHGWGRVRPDLPEAQPR